MWRWTLTAAVLLVAVARADNPPMFAMSWGSLGNGPGQFDAPTGIALGPDESVYVVDKNNHRIQGFDSYGTFLLTWGTMGTAYGQFSYPRGIAADESCRGSRFLRIASHHAMAAVPVFRISRVGTGNSWVQGADPALGLSIDESLASHGLEGADDVCLSLAEVLAKLEGREGPGGLVEKPEEFGLEGIGLRSGGIQFCDPQVGSGIGAEL
jgi:hypothetical protein